MTSFAGLFTPFTTVKRRYQLPSTPALVQPVSSCDPKIFMCHYQGNPSLDPSLWTDNFLLSLQLTMSSPSQKSTQILTSLPFWKTQRIEGWSTPPVLLLHIHQWNKKAPVWPTDIIIQAKVQQPRCCAQKGLRLVANHLFLSYKLPSENCFEKNNSS